MESRPTRGAGRAAAAAALAALLALAAPTEAGAASGGSFRVSFTYYGAAVVGGAGVLVYLSAAWEALDAGAPRAPATALLEIRGGRARAGLPLPRPSGGGDPASGRAAPGVALDLLRVRF